LAICCFDTIEKITSAVVQKKRGVDLLSIHFLLLRQSILHIAPNLLQDKAACNLI
jgi:hypothetical protein